MNWLPIETAPKDGSMILVCLPRQMNIVVRARYDRIHKHWLTDYEGEGGISQGAFFHQGDLWHPVPPPPTTTSKTSNLQEKCRIETVPAQGGVLSTMKEGKDFTTTSQPKREWVGLTDEEIDQGLLRSDYALQTAHAWRAGVVFAMTKLKEKNT